jgi:hypothetical protein
MVQVGDIFDSIPTTREAIKSYILTHAESFKTITSDKKWYIITCKEASCSFKIRAHKSSKEVISITMVEPHTCSLAMHYKMKQTSLV